MSDFDSIAPLYQVVVATPRVLKPDEERLVTFYLKLGADSLLIRSLGLLNQMVELGGAGMESMRTCALWEQHS